MRLLLICLGGAAGTAARYGVNFVTAGWLGLEFPFGTLAVNVVGSFLIGLVQHVGPTLVSDTTRLALVAGLLGGFTTYSSFSYETLRLAQTGAWLAAGLNVVATTTLCLIACALGFEVGRMVIAAR